MRKDEIVICANHERKVPMIWTFAFPGAEYWCPYCGATGGMFGAGNYVPETPELVQMLQELKEQSKEFLSARARLVCTTLEWEGKRIRPDELPKEEIDRLRALSNSWKYPIKEAEPND